MCYFFAALGKIHKTRQIHSLDPPVKTYLLSLEPGVQGDSGVVPGMDTGQMRIPGTSRLGGPDTESFNRDIHLTGRTFAA